MDWIYKSSDPLWETLAVSVLIFGVVIVFTRLAGLRSFAKFTAFDFASTVAIGSIISSVLTSKTSLVYGAVAIGSLLLITYLVSSFQRKWPKLGSIISNQPLLLMCDGEILNDNLKAARIEKGQLIAKLREANVLHYDQVKAVVLESTGDISVLHAAEDGTKLDDSILEGVKFEV